MHILLHVIDNFPSWISGRERMTTEKISRSISMKEWCRTGAANRRPPDHQSCMHLTELLSLEMYIDYTDCIVWPKSVCWAHMWPKFQFLGDFHTRLYNVLHVYQFPTCQPLTDHLIFQLWWTHFPLFLFQKFHSTATTLNY